MLLINFFKEKVHMHWMLVVCDHVFYRIFYYRAILALVCGPKTYCCAFGCISIFAMARSDLRSSFFFKIVNLKRNFNESNVPRLLLLNSYYFYNVKMTYASLACQCIMLIFAICLL